MEAFDLIEKVLGTLTALFGLVTAVVELVRRKRAIRTAQRATDSGAGRADVATSTEEYRKSAKRLLWVVIIMTAMMVLVIWAYYRAPVSVETANRIVTRLDASVFPNGNAEFGRVFGDDTALRAHGKLDDVINGTHHSFDLAARHAASVVQEYGPTIKEALSRGVSIRIVVMDPSVENEQALLQHVRASNRGGQLLELRQRINQTISSVRSLRKESGQRVYRGSIEIRVLRGLMLHSMWIRDGGTQDTNSLVHLGYYWYRGSQYAPSMRASSKTSPTVVDNAIQEFNAMWSDSTPTQ